jgi:hypothetical protein
MLKEISSVYYQFIIFDVVGFTGAKAAIEGSRDFSEVLKKKKGFFNPHT